MKAVKNPFFPLNLAGIPMNQSFKHVLRVNKLSFPAEY
jgi:hypothetical protein